MRHTPLHESAGEQPRVATEPDGTLSGASHPGGARHVAGELAYRYALVFGWVAVIGLFAGLRPDTFATTGNFQTIFGSQSVLVVLTMAVMFPLIVGEFDLSIGATLGFAAILVVVLNVTYGWPLGFAVLVAIAAGPLIGLLNGFFVVIVGVDALVATLGTGTLITGVGFAVSNYAIIGGVNHALTQAVSERFLGLPLSFYYGLGLCLFMWYLFRYTPLGRHLLFVGAGREVARLSGLRVQAIRLGAFVACGFIAALAGVMFAGVLGAADPNAGITFLLPAYAAAFLGATAVNPGQFNPWGSFIAVYFLITGVTGLQLLGLEDWIQQVFYGTVLVAAVTLSRLATRKRI